MGASLVLALLTGIILAPAARAEGSKELTAQGGNRAYLEWRPAGLLGGIPRKTAMKVYADVGETINLGSSAAGLGSGTINYRRPDGTSGSCGATGRINDRTEESTGPEPVTGTGYAPCTVAVGGGEAGVWEIDFVSPAPANTANPPALAASANWSQPSTVSYVSAWDVTVRSAGGTTIPGRAFTNYLSLNMGANTIAFNPELFVQTLDGHRYRVSPNGLDPFVFIFFANNQGFRSTTGALLYRSVQLNTTTDAFQNGENVHNPNAPDTASDVTHKIFLATPDPALPASAPSPTGNTWLLVPPTDPPTPSNFTFEGSEGTPGQAGQGAGGVFRFDSSDSGNHAVTLDLNGDGTYGNGNDRVLAGVTSAGANQVVWDGRDGNGATVPNSASAFQVRLTLHSAEVHFPLLDAENNPNGLILERQIPVPGAYTVFYNDTGLSGGTPPSPADARLGVSSQTGAQAFSGGFGDHKGIDTWTYRTSSPEPLAGGVEVAQADLTITNTDGNTTTSVGQPITYTVRVTNNGPSGVNGAGFSDTVPAGVSGVSWTCQVTSGTGSCAAAAGSGNNVSTALDLDTGAVATVTITGTVDPAAPRTLSNTATIARPNDVVDPDTSNNSATDDTTIEHPPTVTLGGLANVDESSSAERTYTFSVADPDPGSSFTVVGGPSCGAGGAFVVGSLTTDAGGGSFRCVFTDGPASPTLSIQVRDATSLSDDDTLAVTVANVAPAIASVTNSGPIDEGSSATVTVTASDPAGPADALTYEFDCNGDGDYSDPEDVGPQAGASASCTYGSEGMQIVNVRVRDGDGGTTTSFTAVSVGNVAPGTAPDSYATDEDSALPVAAPGVLGNDSDRPDDPLSAQLVGQAANGLASIANDGSFLYTPIPNFNGTDTFTYRVCDDEGACSVPETVTITVRPVNDGPDAVDDSAGTNEDTDATIDVLDNDTDVEGSPLEVIAFTQPSNGQVTCIQTTGVCTYTPDPDYNGGDSFTYTISDGAREDTATVQLTVSAVNDAPSTSPDAYTVPEDGELTEDVPGVLDNDTDIDGDPLTAELVSGPSNGTLSLQPDGSFVYRPDADFTGTDSFTYRACDAADPRACSVPETVTIAVETGNDAPRTEPDDNDTLEDEALSVDGPGVLGNDRDPESGALTAELQSGPAHGTLELRPDGSFAYRPDADFFGEDSFTYRACDDADPRACSEPETVTLVVAEVNDDPVADDDAGATEMNLPTTVGVLEGDVDSDDDELRVSDFTQPSSGTVDCTPAGVCNYAPAQGFVGTASFEYTVSDGRGGTDRAIVTITVQAGPPPPNQVPLAADDNAETPAGQPVAIPVLGNDQDADGGQLTIDVFTKPQHGSVSRDSQGRLVYQPDGGFTGTDSFDYTVLDGQGGAATARVTITVRAQPSPANRPPAPVDDQTTTTQGDTVKLNVLDDDSDPDGDELTVTRWTQPRHGTVTCDADGRCTYRPDPGFVGTDRFTYTVSDGRGARRTATVSVRVRGSQASQPDRKRLADDGGSTRGDQGEGSPTVPAVDDGSPSEPPAEPVADEPSDGGSLPHTGLALGALAGLGLALLGAGVAGRRGLGGGAARSEDERPDADDV